MDGLSLLNINNTDTNYASHFPIGYEIMFDLLKNQLDTLSQKSKILLGDSQLPRLIQMREQQGKACGCERCEDFVSKLHYSGLMRQHIVENLCRHFWAFGADRYGGVNAAAYSASKPPEQRHKFITDMIAFENEWSSRNKDNCVHRMSENVWLDQWYQIESEFKLAI